MYSKLLSWSRGLYLAGIVLALVLVIPTAWFPFQLAKVTVFALFLAVAVILLVWGRGVREVVRSHGFYAALLVALLPLSYLVSALFSVDRSVAFTGFGVETDTILFVTLAALAFIMSFAYFRTLRTARFLLMVVFWALIVAAVFQCISIVFGSSAIPLATFANRSVNLVGKWNDLGMLVGLLSMLFLVRVELMQMSNLWKLVTGLLLAVLGALLGIINFPLVWGLVLGFSIVLAIVRFIIQRQEPTESMQTWVTRIPWFALVAAVVSVLFLFFGSTFNTGLTSLFPVSSLEVRPSYSSTLDIINAARGGSFERVLVGTGPNTFGQEWLLNKPAEVNQSAFWSLDFNVGFSTFITALGTVGFLGILAWLMPLFLVLAALVRVVRLGVLNREDKIVATTFGIASLFLLASILLYVPSQNIILLAFVFSGAAFGFLWRQGQSSVETEYRSRLGQLAAIAAIVVLVAVSLWSAFAISRRLVVEAYAGASAQSLSDGNSNDALSEASRAAGIEKNGDALRAVLAAQSAKLQQLASATSTPTAQLQQEFSSTVQAAIAAGQSAEALNPHDYRPTLALAQVYDYLSTLSVQGAAQTAAQTYLAAQAQNPTNPAIPLAMARLAAGNNDAADTTVFLKKALTLKSNYTDAILLVVQLDVANKDIPSAIKAATAAAQTAPGVAPIWFELGLLYYSNGDAKDAAAALKQAVAIQPDYANAQYFLGLSDYILGDVPDAIAQFQALNKSNPGNSEVELILGNLTSGKQPFAGAQPPVTSKPQDRTTAPISQ
ncbi:MAG: tetratricopeptide repeat protein [Patescibacteria group bacterium]|nr:tetratricopeptide repeat protein [Patescibacteria group bacterium]